jgi:hypothetical protein
VTNKSGRRGIGSSRCWSGDRRDGNGMSGEGRHTVIKTMDMGECYRKRTRTRMIYISGKHNTNVTEIFLTFPIKIPIGIVIVMIIIVQRIGNRFVRAKPGKVSRL